MSPLHWTWRQLALCWLGALAISAVLIVLAGRIHPRPAKVVWLVPYPRDLTSALRLGWTVSREFATARPLEAIALLGIPILMAGATLAWGVAYLWRR